MVLMNYPQEEYISVAGRSSHLTYRGNIRLGLYIVQGYMHISYVDRNIRFSIVETGKNVCSPNADLYLTIKLGIFVYDLRIIT